jgi:hypothetical protein
MEGAGRAGAPAGGGVAAVDGTRWSEKRAKCWHLPGQEDFEVWFAGYTDRAGYPWDPYLESYEGAGKASKEFKKRFEKIDARWSEAGGR